MDILLRFHCNVYFSLTIVFFLRVRSWTLCAQWMCHVLRTRLLCIPASRITCHRLVYSYVPVSVSHVPLTVQIWIVDSSTYISRLLLSPFVLSTRLCLPMLLMSFLFSLSTRLSSRYFWTMTRHQVISLFCIFVLVSRILLYIRVGDGTAPHLQSTLQPP